MTNKKTILLHNITPDELKELIVIELKKEIEAVLQKHNKPKNYSVQDVAKLISRSELTIYNYIKKRILPATKIGRKYVINRVDLEESLLEVKTLKYRR